MWTVLALLFSFNASAATSTNGVKDFTIHQNYLSVRALGMGNSYTALADDYNTLFYNPAGLSRLEQSEVNLGFGALVDPKAIKLEKDITNASNGPDATKAQDMVNLISSNYGNHYSARAPMLGGFWVKPKWGVAFIPADLNIELEIHDLGVAAVNVVATQDSTLAYGRGWDVHWFDKSDVSIGVTGKAVYRAAYINSILAADLALNNNLLRVEDAQEGLTFDADVGMLISPSKGRELGFWGHLIHPTWGLVAHNIVDYGFTSNLHLLNSNTSGAPPKLGRVFDVGAKWDLPDWWIWRVHAMADLHDMGHENWTFKKGSHIGAEFNWKIRSWWQGGWRVGVNQGYFTAGFTGRLALFNLDVAYYSEEVGSSDSPKADNRYVAKASLDW